MEDHRCNSLPSGNSEWEYVEKGLSFREVGGSRHIFGDWRGWFTGDVDKMAILGPFATQDEAAVARFS